MNNAARAAGVCCCSSSALAAALAVDAGGGGGDSVDAHSGASAEARVGICMAHPVAAVTVVAAA
jgi:hypothetical protein